MLRCAHLVLALSLYTCVHIRIFYFIFFYKPLSYELNVRHISSIHVGSDRTGSRWPEPEKNVWCAATLTQNPIWPAHCGPIWLIHFSWGSLIHIYICEREPLGGLNKIYFIIFDNEYIYILYKGRMLDINRIWFFFASNYNVLNSCRTDRYCENLIQCSVLYVPAVLNWKRRIVAHLQLFKILQYF